MAALSAPTRRLPVGAEVQPGGGVHFRVWAPAAAAVSVEFDDGAAAPLAAEPGGYYAGRAERAGPGMRYRFRLAGRPGALPDPASRCQPNGPHGSSEIVDPAGFAWSDAAWRGVAKERLVIYEMHVGTFTADGSWAAAAAHLPALAELGVTAVEMMPVAEFPGDFGWGYDGVDLFAPSRLYGRPNDLRRFVDRAHVLGLAVLLDVVCNHLGPDGNYLAAYASAYMHGGRATEWGQALNFSGDRSGPVREFFIANAGYWIDEYHFDGLRLDATHRILDDPGDHILAAIGRRVREAGGGRITFVAAEDEARRARLVRPAGAGGYGLDAIWNDDFHHSARVALTGRREGYYRAFHGNAGEFVALAKHGLLFQGQHGSPQQAGRGTPALDLCGGQFVAYLQNHDQIAHSADGRRGHRLASPGCWRALSAWLLLGPFIPLLFQGQEFAASAPFLYFADHRGELGRLVADGRREFLAQFPSLAAAEMQAALADPTDPATFHRCVLDHRERERNREAVALHRDLIALRRDDPVLRGPYRLDGATFGEDAFVLRYFAGARGDRLLLVNLGRDRRFALVAEPLLAPPAGWFWHELWSSEAVRYGGAGIPEPVADGVWHLPGHAAIVLAPS